MLSSVKMDGTVQFSVEKIEFLNKYRHRELSESYKKPFQKKSTYFLQNRCKTSKNVRVSIPRKGNDPVFHLLHGSEEQYLASGLRLPVVICYRPTELANHKSRLEIYVDDALHKSVLIEAYPPSPCLEVSPLVVNFGTVVCECQIVSQTISISNSGKKECHFQLDTRKLPHNLKITPTEGTVHSGQMIMLNVELLCKVQGIFSEDIRILSDDSTVLVKLKGNIVPRILELLDVSGSKIMSKIAFGKTYYGSMLKVKVNLHNNCPTSTNYIVLLDENAVGSEKGVDMNEGLAMACSRSTKWKEQGFSSAIDSLIQVCPSQGLLGPYEKCYVELTFNPQFTKSDAGWDQIQGLPNQRDYVLFLKFLPICSGGEGAATALEVAVTGTACPMSLDVHPDKSITFGDCPLGTFLGNDIQVCNNSNILPLKFRCRQPAHYKCLPSAGQISPGEVLTMSIVFQPRQMGPLNCQLFIDFFEASSTESMAIARDEVLCSTVLNLKGSGRIDSASVEHRTVQFACPNDQATSVRPHDGTIAVITPHTKVARYTYVDQDYSYSSKELLARKHHQAMYSSYITRRRNRRKWKNREKELTGHVCQDPSDMSIQPAQGLKPPALKVVSVHVVDNVDLALPDAAPCTSRLITNSSLKNMVSEELSYVERCPTKPLSSFVESNCNTVLTPKQLSLIVIEPNFLDYGCVVINSVSKKIVTIKNFTHLHTIFKFKLSGSKVYCNNYGDSSTVQIVLAPRSYTQLCFALDHKSLGQIEGSIEYVLNGHHSYHLSVEAEVTLLSLSLSTETLILTEPYFASHTAGLRGSVAITNKHKVPLAFQWHGREGVDTDVFNMMHPAGVVSAGATLMCEFICQPSFNCPSFAQFLLDVTTIENYTETSAHSSKDIQPSILKLVTQFRNPVCAFRERRVLFGTIPLFLNSTQNVHIENQGECHAYFKVSDSCPYPGMHVHPVSGCIPVGGEAELAVLFQPSLTGPFDVKLNVLLKEGKSITLRIAGSVDQPIVSIDKNVFDFGGVYCGSRANLPFTVSNKTATSAHLSFDFSHLPDFSLVYTSEKKPKMTKLSSNAGAQLNLAPNSETKCKLEFCPKEVAAYDLYLPILVNGVKPAVPPPLPWPPSQSNSSLTLLKGVQPSFSTTPIRRIIATALRPPLVVSHSELSFSIPPTFFDGISEPIQHPEAIVLKNIGDKVLNWGLDCSHDRIMDGTFQFVLPDGSQLLPPVVKGSVPFSNYSLIPGEEFSFMVLCSPVHHGTFTASVPLILNCNAAQPYQILELTADLPSGKFRVDPPHVVVQPVPLGLCVNAQFTVTVENFLKPVKVEAMLPSVENFVHFEMRIPEDMSSVECRAAKKEILCFLEFSSSHPVSISDTLIFIDKTSGKRKRVPFSVCADNSIFTVYEFFAQNVNSASVYYNEMNTPMLQLHESRKHHDDGFCSSTSCVAADTVPSFSTSPTFADIFLQDTISSLCRWLSTNGWSQGIRSVEFPIDLNVPVKADDLQKPGEKQRSSIIQSRGPLLDLLVHLCGQLPPGIPINPPPCSTTAEKVNLLYSTYKTVIEFLRNHGGMMWNVVPEALLDYQSYIQWTRDIAGITPTHFIPEDEREFDDMSKRAWTHILMQIVKVLVLRQVTKYIPPYLKTEVASFSPWSSNFFSKPERVLLSWVNHHYNLLCNKLFHRKGPDVVNFEVDFMDSSVLACLLSSYCPFLIESHFQKLYAEPTSPEECSHNAIILVAAINNIGLEYDIQPNDICSPNPVSMILFCVFLYQKLRFYKPTRSLTFQSLLKSPVKQGINLENHSMKPLKYRILVRGKDTKDFIIYQSDGIINIEGGKTKQLSIGFTGCSLHASSAVLLLVATGKKTTSGKTLSLSLSGVVTGAKPQSVTTIEASLYQPQTIPIDVTKAGTHGRMFSIRLCESSGDLNDSMKSDSNCKLKQRTGQLICLPSLALQQRSADGINLFSIATKQQEIFVCSDASTQLVLNFVPLKMEPRQCAVVLSNTDLGDIVFYISVSVKNPRPITPQAKFLHPGTIVNKETSTLYMKSCTGEVIEEEIIVHSSNTALEKAALYLSKAEMTTKEIKRRLLTESLHYAALSTAVAALKLNPTGSLCEEDEHLTFTVRTSDSVHYSLPKEISIPTGLTGFGVLPVKFCCTEEGQYECHIVLESKHDIRIIIIETTVMARERQARLEFNTQAMQSIAQDIPIVNPSSADWPLVASISGIGFVGPDSLVARAVDTTNYQLQFSPVREGTVEGFLSLKNTIDSSEHFFMLKGVATRPLAQENVRLKAQVKQSMSHIIHVPNLQDRTAVFAVESDLGFISGPSTVTIGGNDIVDYPLTVYPKQSGTFSGALVFVAKAYSKLQSFTEALEIPDQTKQEDPYHMWFQIQCSVDPAPPDEVLTISCNVFSSKTLQLSLTNPISDPLVLQVFVDGHGMSGNDCLYIKPNGKETYSVLYSPVRAGKHTGRIVFSGSPEGEIWYEVLMVAKDPKPKDLPELQCELGRTCCQCIVLNNCLNESVEFTCNNVNTKHFTVTGLATNKVTVEPNTSVDIPVLFIPSSVGADGHSTEVVFSSKQFGSQVFDLHGVGVPPTTMEFITISANLGSSSMHVINFTNPFDVPVPLSFSLEGKDVDHFFLLLKHPQVVNLQPKEAIDVPVMFSPESMYKHQVTVVITAEGDTKHCVESLSWKYPVLGQPQIRPYPEKFAPRVQCCVKERIEEILQVVLVNSVSSQVAAINAGDRCSTVTNHDVEVCDEEAFSYKLMCQNPKYSSLVERSTGIRLLAKGMIEHEQLEALDLVIVFAPPKAFSCMCDLQVSSKHGGVWFFPVHFSAIESAPDDIITIQAEGLHKEAKVGFRLTSMSKHPLKFTSRLLYGSDKEITVLPKSGVLTPVNSNGTLFCISYKPEMYGRDHHAKLVIQTETHEWVYKIVGRLPKYTPPHHVAAKVQHTLSLHQ